MTFGQASEKLSLQIVQLDLALAELGGEADVADSRTADRAPAQRPSPLRALPDHLPRTERRIEPEAGNCTCPDCGGALRPLRSEEHTSELQSLMRISYAVFCLKKKNKKAKHKYLKSINNKKTRTNTIIYQTKVQIHTKYSTRMKL